MNFTLIDNETLLQTISESCVLERLEWEGILIHVAERDGVDILIFEAPFTCGGIVVQPDWLDDEAGGSVHDHARWSFIDSDS